LHCAGKENIASSKQKETKEDRKKEDKEKEDKRKEQKESKKEDFSLCWRSKCCPI
jgi:hypothetical protein